MNADWASTEIPCEPNGVLNFLRATTSKTKHAGKHLTRYIQNVTIAHSNHCKTK